MEHLNYSQFQKNIGNSKNGQSFNALVTETTIIDFYASWCGPCKVLGPILENLEKEMTNVKIFKVDVDEESELANDLGIMSIPTIMVLKEGKPNLVKIGLLNNSQILELLK